METKTQPQKKDKYYLSKENYVYEIETPDEHLHFRSNCMKTMNANEFDLLAQKHGEKIVKAINFHNELIEAIEQEMEHLEEWNGHGNYTGRIERLKELLKKAK